MEKIKMLGAAEIGERLGVSPQRVQQLIWRHDFPRPYQTLRMGSIWTEADINAWIAENRPHLAQQPGEAEEP